ncbi:stage III sporulation protein AG [Effusibacillus consociatus]|uniref:Stage III sporulation protein AG n=1 Tax=Effusibacillus consociatus TaxID=1117041 RepID=A0ABV9Q6K8_9BACL
MNFDFNFLTRIPKWTYILAALGLILILFGSFNSPKTVKQSETAEATKVVNTDSSTISRYERLYEEKLAQVLNQIDGVSEVTIMVNLDSTEELVLAENVTTNRQTNQERDKQGGERMVTTVNENKQLVMMKGSPDNPVVVRTIKPHVRGVLVVAKGAQQPRIEALIKESVQRVLEVPSHRISVQPKKSN